MDKKLKYLIISIAVMIIVIITGTFAWLTFRSTKTAMVLTIGDINNVQVTLQPYQINANIVPRTTFSTTDNNIKSVNVEAVNNTGYKKRVRLYYNINEIDEDLVSNNFQYVIMKKTENDSDYTSYKTGNFSSASVEQEFEILNEKIPETSTSDYKVYLWLNGVEVENAQGVSFNGELRADVNFENKMKASTTTSSSKVFDSGINRSDVEKITFLNVIPDNITSADQPQDVSLDGNNDVIAFFKDENSNSLYEMYIAADGQIVPSNLVNFFGYFTIVTEINNLNYLDTGDVTSMNGMFRSCFELLSLDLSGFDTSNVTNMDSMFFYCERLSSLDLSNFDTSNVTSMATMFSDCTHLTTININDWNTSNVTSMGSMFWNCRKLTSLNLLHFDTSKVKNMGGMFYNCLVLTTLDLSSFDTSNVVYMDEMFENSENLTNIYVSDRWDTSKVSESWNMFECVYELPNYDGSVVDKTNAHYGSGGYLTYKPYP